MVVGAQPVLVAWYSDRMTSHAAPGAVAAALTSTDPHAGRSNNGAAHAPGHAAEAGAQAQAGGAWPPGHLLEVSWEVCNPVGGIFQVVRSKAPFMVDRWGERYCLVGPYNPQAAALEFEETTPTGVIGRAVNALRAEGMNVRHGRWMISGRPRTVLIDHWVSQAHCDGVKYTLYADHHIPTPGGDTLIDGVVSFADAVRRLVEKVCEQSAAGGVIGPAAGPVIAHFHEYMGGLAIPMLRRNRAAAALVFQTHATLLARYIASNEEDFYDRLSWGTIDHIGEARKYQVQTQHLMERACAHGSHVMTTVSAVTAEECDGLLGRRPDVVLPNGLDIQRFNVGHEFQTLHATYKDKINRFVMGHFFPSYPMDLDRTLYMFTSGRYEPRNKGFDLCLEAMARLNAELKAAALGINVVFFIITKRPTRSLHPAALSLRGVLNEFRWVCEQITSHLGETLFKQGAAGKRVDLEKALDEYWALRYRRTQQALKTDRLPLVTTHMIDDDHDPVLAQIRSLGLLNRPEDPVKIVYHPDFISPVNPLWGMEYEQFVRGCHVGIFPSAYEPWGYTPLECVAMGVPAVSSDLAGFGAYVMEQNRHHERPGMWVIRRRSRGFHDAAADLTRNLLEFCRLDRRGRIALRNQVEAQSWSFDWGMLGPAYSIAHDLALQRAFGLTPAGHIGA